MNGATVGGIGTAGTNGLGDKLPTGGTAPVGTVETLPLGTLGGLAGNGKDAVEAYVRQAAVKNGIDPDVFARVVKQESGFKFDATHINSREESYGPMQLNAMGGLGADALKQGINIRDPSNWRQTVDFGAGVAAKDGWRQWYGARDVGISRWQGIGKGGPDHGSSSDALSQTADKATQSVTDLSTKLGDMPDAANAFTSSISSIEQSLQKGLGSSGGGFGGLGGLGFGSGGGGNIPTVDGGQMIGGTQWFANGGIMTSRGQIPLNRYAGGGVANSPQIAMFGEGRGPEAYVPLPDGRSIPVSMKGMPVNTNAPGPAPMSITHNPTTIIQGSNLSRDDMLATLNQRDAENRRVLLGEIDNRQRRYG